MREFVRRGGSIVATYETSLYDEWGARRADFGLADLFGVSFAGRIEGPMQNSYLHRRGPARRGTRSWRASKTPGASSTASRRVEVEARANFAPPPLTLIPSYPDLPMEMVYPRVPKTDIPGVCLREIGAGPRRLLPLGHRPRLLGGALRRPRQAAAQRGRLGG